jgi:hypothetical protein
VGSPADQPQEQKALTFDTARAIQVDIEQLPGSLCSHLVSLADRPTAYRVELRMGGVYPHEVARFAEIAARHDAAVKVLADDCDPAPACGLLVRFDKPRRAV